VEGYGQEADESPQAEHLPTVRRGVEANCGRRGPAMTDEQVNWFYDFMCQKPGDARIVAREFRRFVKEPFHPQTLREVVDRGVALGLWTTSPVPGTVRLIR
jgi:hypothetical protein